MTGKPAVDDMVLGDLTLSKKKVVGDCLTCGHCWIRSKRPTRVPLLTKRHRQLRLRWTREHCDWFMAQWERAAWSDESCFVIHHADGRVRVRRLPSEQLLPQCTVDHTQAGGGGMGDVLLGVSGCSRADRECCRASEHHCGPVAPLYGLCFSRWKWNFPTGQRPVSQG
ncbi:HTH_Tnp_Tc3_2 domain-containing protein [Trichonephila clavipes]|nr:HTH_Tnp_Tc3_2 domain-containing protein [Trichonephila clavipes]